MYQGSCAELLGQTLENTCEGHWILKTLVSLSDDEGIILELG